MKLNQYTLKDENVEPEKYAAYINCYVPETKENLDRLWTSLLWRVRAKTWKDRIVNMTGILAKLIGISLVAAVLVSSEWFLGPETPSSVQIT